MLSSASKGLKQEESSSNRRMTSNLLIRRNLITTRLERSVLSLTSEEEDDDVSFDTSDSNGSCEALMSGKQYPSVQEFASAIPNHLLLGSLLEHLCFVYESDPTRSRMLFKVIGQRLAAMNLLSPLAISDEFSTVRLQHNRAFTELLHAASTSLFPQGQMLLNKDTQSLTVRPQEGLFQAQTSRYLSEFEEISRLGKGSYGKVFKVTNKLDGQNYAVKKIQIKNVSRDDCMKVLREVKVLSSLQHHNIVGYHTAWMEHVQPAATDSEPKSGLPALEPLARPDGTDSSDNSSTGSSIVFESSDRTNPDPVKPTAEAAHTSESLSSKALVLNQGMSKVRCPKTMQRLPENYVPCVFLGRKGPPANGSLCPAVNLDASALSQQDSRRNKLELQNHNHNNNPCMGNEKWADKRPSNEFHLMLYIQMHLCERSLKDWISERNAVPKEELESTCPYASVDYEKTLGVLKNILHGVEYIHSRGIMHRDLKPRNIFLHGHDCHVRIGDFGLACQNIIIEDCDPLLSNSHNNGSAHTTGVGTFVYAAPEQLEGSHYDSKSDMYSVGVLVLELFHPFGTEMERVQTLAGLREGKIPDHFCQRWPVLAKHVALLTGRDPSVRPSATQVLQSELFSSKDMVIHGLQRRVEKQEEEIEQLRRQISLLQSTQNSAHLLDKT